MLDGDDRTLRAFGPGEFFSRRPVAEGAVDATVRASWTESLAFDDAAGTLVLEGDVQGEHRPEPNTVETFRGDYAEALLATAATEEPGPGAPSPGEPGTESAPTERAVQRLVLLGGERPARVESRVYADAAHSRPLRLLRLDAGVIDASETEGVLHTPASGSIVVLDQQPGTSDDQRARALLGWQDSMRYNRVTGEAVLRGDAQVTHQRLSDGEVTQIDGQELRVTLADGDGQAAESAAAAVVSRVPSEVRSARAFGRVYARSGEQEVRAGELLYDAERGTARALAAADGVVTFLDPARAAPVTAAEILWDLVRDRIDIIRPGGVSGGVTRDR